MRRQLTDAAVRRAAAIRRRSGNASRNASTSASVDDQPTLTRSERSASTPIAASTGDGSSVSLEHDEPECTATPCWSSASRIGSASTPSTPRHTRWGRQSVGSPKRSTPGTRRPASAREPLGRARAPRRLRVEPSPRRARPRRRRSRRSRARPRCRPAARAPARRRPRTAGTAARAGRAARAAPFGPAELVRGDRAEVGAERGEVDGDVPGGRARVDVHDDAARRAPRATIVGRAAAACRPRGWRAAPTRARCRAGCAASDLVGVEAAERGRRRRR